uniref:AP-2 complex subunit alpha n=1 Tax=Candidozyma auris TaxID=498019 RepID=A0A0L0P4X2_CANAR
MPATMKGLTQFIVDLRNSKDAEEEHKRINLEINNVRSKFTLSLNSYQKKKYLCKLMYIYLLGYTDEVQFGLKKAFDLIASSDYGEKQVGYLLVSILYSRSNTSLKAHLEDLLELIGPHLLSDLKSNSDDVNCLAIQFIASNFNVCPQDSTVHNSAMDELEDPSSQWQELVRLLYQHCVSPTTKAFTRRKAVITFYVLLKLFPLMILLNDRWIPRLLALVDDKETSVVLSVIPLVKLLVDLKPKYAKSLLPSIANRLHSILVEENCPEDYYYYDVPAPWLVVKLFQLVEHFFILGENSDNPVIIVGSIDNQTLSKLRQAVSRLIKNASRPVKGPPSRNSQSSILFQAVSLAVFLDASVEAIEGAICALVQLLTSPETNNRYLVLDALMKLSVRASTTGPFQDHLEKIFRSLYDKDISVRKKSADLLFTVCDEKTYTQIISRLLEYLPLAESSLKADISVKIAVLAEKFATDSIWYISTMLRLLSIGGRSVRTTSSNGVNSSGEVWERIVQIIVNNEDLQKKACKLIINLLRKEEGLPADSLIRVAALVLGDYGSLAAEEDQANQFSIFSQFRLLYEAYFKAQVSTRPLLLTTFIKILVRFPDENYVPDILDLFEAECLSLDLEIQTRAHEYLKLGSLTVNGTQEEKRFSQSVIKSLPPFDVKLNSLMNHLRSLQVIRNGRSRSTVNVLKVPRPKGQNQNLGNPSDFDSDLSDAEENPDESGGDPFGDRPTSSVTKLSPNWYSGYHRMLHYDAGIFYEDQLIKITYRLTKRAAKILYQFTIINNAAKTANTDITALTVLDLKNPGRQENPSYFVKLNKVPDSTVGVKTAMEIEATIRHVVEDSESPVISLSYRCGGSFTTLHLRIPVVLLKTLSTTELSLEEFKKRWFQIGEALGSQAGEKRGVVRTNHKYILSNVLRTLQRLGFAVVHCTPDNTSADILVMAAGILHTTSSNYGVLLSMRSLEADGRLFDLTIRCTGGGVPEVIYLSLEEVFDNRS